MAYELNGQTFESDEEGYLVDLAAWNPDKQASNHYCGSLLESYSLRCILSPF